MQTEYINRINKKYCVMDTLNPLTCVDGSTNTKKTKQIVMCRMSCVMYRLSHVTCLLTNALRSFSFYESPKTFGDAAEGGLVIDRKYFFGQNSKKKIYLYFQDQ